MGSDGEKLSFLVHLAVWKTGKGWASYKIQGQISSVATTILVAGLTTRPRFSKTRSLPGSQQPPSIKLSFKGRRRLSDVTLCIPLWSNYHSAEGTTSSCVMLEKRRSSPSLTNQLWGSNLNLLPCFPKLSPICTHMLRAVFRGELHRTLWDKDCFHPTCRRNTGDKHRWQSKSRMTRGFGAHLTC